MKNLRSLSTQQFLALSIITAITIIGFGSFGNSIYNNQVSTQNIDSESGEVIFGDPSSPSPTFVNPNLNESCTKPNVAPRPLKVGITHFQYQEASRKNLVTVEDGHQLHKDASVAYKKMQTAAAKDGAYLRIISGFRSISDQASIVSRKENEGQSDKEIYLKSASPGNSEHHTGYAFDANSLSTSFEYEKAGKWLKNNASKYGFEMSYPRGNKQNISFEPWHFRFIGTSDAFKTFCYAHGLQKIVSRTLYEFQSQLIATSKLNKSPLLS